MASADKFAAEAHDLTKLKQYSAAIERLKSAVDTLNPKDLDKSETEIASKRVFEFTLKISENYFEAKDMDQALNFCQIVHHTDRANLGAALLISKIYIQKNQENEALEALTNTLSKCKKDDQSETYRQVAEEQKRLQNKLKPASQQPKEEPEVKKFNKVQPPAENDNKGEKSEKDWGYISAFGVVGAVVGFATGYALKLSNPKKLLTTAVLAVGSGLIAYYKGDDDDKKK